jgi:hypothetical protein
MLRTQLPLILLGLLPQDYLPKELPFRFLMAMNLALELLR